jgi:hypothetical protein
MTFCIGRHDFITLLGGVIARPAGMQAMHHFDRNLL